MSDPVQLSVKVIAPEDVLYEGTVYAVSGTNSVGPFAILPGHANFISLIQGTLRLHRTKHEATEIKLEQGIVFCRNNQVEVYVAAMVAVPSAA